MEKTGQLEEQENNSFVNSAFHNVTESTIPTNDVQVTDSLNGNTDTENSKTAQTEDKIVQSEDGTTDKIQSEDNLVKKPIPNVNEAKADNECDKTVKSKIIIKGIYPDLSASADSNSVLESKKRIPSELPVNNQEMGCTSSKEKEDLSQELNFMDVCKSGGQNENNRMIENEKVSTESQITNGITGGKISESDISTAIHETQINKATITGGCLKQDHNHEVNVPGKAVRVESPGEKPAVQNDANIPAQAVRVESPGEKPAVQNDANIPAQAVRVESPGEEPAVQNDANIPAQVDGNTHGDLHSDGSSRDPPKENDCAQSDKQPDEENMKIEDKKFSGIDKNWQTNYDDLYEAAHEKYEYFWKRRDIYSQWHFSVFCDELKFTCAEQYMMYQKAIVFGDCKIANKIIKEKDPRKIKSLGRKVHGFTDAVWNDNCLHIVKNGNIAKFSQNKHLKEQLFATYPKIFVEASPFDTIWGIGLVEDDERAWDESTWEGKNYLGYIITEVRDELMADEGIIEKKDKKVYLPTLLEQMETKKETISLAEGTDGTSV